MLDEVEQGRLRPVDVLEHEDLRLCASPLLEDLSHRPEDVFRGTSRQHRRQLTFCFELAKDLHERPVRDALSIGQAASEQHLRLVSQGACAFECESRLADTGRSQHREQAAATLRHAFRRTRSARLRAPRGGRRAERRAGGPIASAPSVTANRRNATRGSTFPLATTGSIGSTSMASRARRNVASPSRISPDSAACSSRAATLTTSPVTSASPAPAMTSPVLTPIRACKPRAVTASRSSTDARSARSASSSWRVGIPKTAITASPINFSTVPPCRSSAVRASSK